LNAILLDTNVFIHLAKPGQSGLRGLPRSTQSLLEDPGSDLRLSVISLAEITIKTTIGKLDLRPQEAMRAAEDMGLALLEFKSAHCLALNELPLHHKDPFDRMLIATAASEGFTLMSKDSTFGRYQQDGFLSLHLIPR
jgi:PIN domain nuclease of toxin-antitoxin system